MSPPFQATQEEHSKTNTQRLLALRVSYLTFGSNDCLEEECIELKILNSKLINSSHRVPQSKAIFICLLSNRGPHNKPRLRLFVMGRRNSGGTCRPQFLNSFPIGFPKSKPRFICLLWGIAEVRVAFNDRAERYHSRNLVTERAVIGQYDLIVERAVTERAVYDLRANDI